MKRTLVAAILLSLAYTNIAALAARPQKNARPEKKERAYSRRATVYYPPHNDWQRKAPEEVGMDAALLAQAVDYAKTQESTVPRDFSKQVETFGAILGPMPKQRGGSSLIVIRHGYIVAEFGETDRVDPTYSVAKSFLSTLLGLALDRGLIKDIQDPVRLYIKDGGYESAHNSKITWHHHAQQTSEWEGVMWGKSHDFLGEAGFGRGARRPRELKEPGSFYEYNDVRINRFALSLLRVWRRPLPEVLKREVMDPIGASPSWQYYGYVNSDVTIDGRAMKSVSGGTRWGGGLWISARDLARFGYLFLRKGRWANRQVVSKRWIEMATTPAAVGPDYGYLWWLNIQRNQWPDAPGGSFAALGYGSNTVWVDPDHDLVIVWRWHRTNGNELFKQILASIKNTDAN
jgi:CubicO group peptidase (beta-lactamase class C family)